MADKTKTFCRTKKLTNIATTLDEFKGMSEARIFNKTGCLPHCERDEITIDDTGEGAIWESKKKPTFTMIFIFEDDSYQLEKEYFVYNFNDFIADVGGFLGLLLGHSVLSMYHMSAEWFADTKIWRALFKRSVDIVRRICPQ